MNAGPERLRKLTGAVTVATLVAPRLDGPWSGL